MKKTLLNLSIILFSLSSMSQIDIADGRTYGIGQTITVTGVATCGSELGVIRYMQDYSAGIAAYGGPITSVSRGDSITVTGPLIEFAGLLEISTVTNVVNHGQANVIPNPLQIPISSAGEALESQLIQFQNVTFVESGTFSGNTNYTLTDGINNIQCRIFNGTSMVGTSIPTGQLTVTGLLGQYNADYQILPRDINDIAVYIPPTVEANVLINGITEINNSNYFYGNSSSINVTIENLGVSDLIVSSLSFTGPNAGEFFTPYSGSSIPGFGSETFTVSISPIGNGSIFASMEIVSNDIDENPYVVNFEGVGNDNLATEPSSNPSGLTFPIIEAYTIGAQYNPGNGASNYLVLWKNGSPITSVPVDGNSYLRGDIVGDARVAYVGPGTSFTPRGIIANQDYYFSVYAFNGSGGYENYLTNSPAIGNISSLGENIGSYYNGISTASPTFVSDLNTLINPHTMITYFVYKQTMMNEFEVKDTIGGQSYVTCALSGEKKVFDDPFDWTATQYSREHTFAHSWFPSWPANSPEQPEYNDQHNLYPANLYEANTPRSNLPLGDIDGNIVFTYLEGSVGMMGSQMVYEPRDSHKGNAARAIMYIAVAYGFNLNGDLDSDKQDETILKNWHFNDLPDNYEIARHEYIYNLQGNRNPFIDSVNYACYIDFDNNQFLPNGCPLSIEEILQNNLVVFPVPSTDKLYIQVNDTEINSYSITNLQGSELVSLYGINTPLLELNVSELSAGTYFIIIETPYGSVKRKFIIE